LFLAQQTHIPELGAHLVNFGVERRKRKVLFMNELRNVCTVDIRRWIVRVGIRVDNFGGGLSLLNE
jgi:hypothetical protein